jgi:L-Ala-D/L-Glu epimerase
MHRSLSITHDKFPLRKPFRISRGVKTSVEAITVELGYDGFVGRGEGIPYARYGESVEGSIAAIETVRREIRQGMGRIALLDAMPPGAARNAVDCALWDLKSQRTRKPVQALLNGPQLSSVMTAITIGLDTPALMAAAAAERGAAHTLKIKVDANDPLERIRAVRAAAPSCKLIVDPNESWSFSDLTAAIPEMITLGVNLIEQPLPADDDDQLADFHASIPIAGDESVHGLSSLDRVVDRYQCINIKLDKTGGLTAALMLAEAGRERGIDIMVGCMVCSSLSIAPAAHLAIKARFVDLDGPIDLVTDRANGFAISDTGRISFDGYGKLWGGL